MTVSSGSHLKLKFQNERASHRAELDQAEILESLPVRVTLNTNNDCNIRCKVCGFSYGSHGTMWQEKREMRGSLLKFIAEQLFETAWEVIPTTFGEPTLYKEFKALLRLVGEYQCKMGLYTNGSLLQEELLEELIPILSDLKISFDGASKDTFEVLRSGASYDAILENIGIFNALRSSYTYLSPPTLTMQFTLMRSNILELPQMVELCSELRANRLATSHVYIFEKSLASESLLFDRELSDETIAKTDALARSFGIETIFPRRFLQKIEGYPLFKHGTCSYLYKEAWLDSDGAVHPCFMLDSPVLGNLNHQSFEEIWNGDAYRQMRRTVNSKQPVFSRCRSCPIRIQFDSNYPNEYSLLAFTFC